MDRLEMFKEKCLQGKQHWSGKEWSRTGKDSYFICILGLKVNVTVTKGQNLVTAAVSDRTSCR